MAPLVLPSAFPAENSYEMDIRNAHMAVVSAGCAGIKKDPRNYCSLCGNMFIGSTPEEHEQHNRFRNHQS